MRDKENNPIEFEELSKENQRILLSWVSQFEKTKTIRHVYTSYGLKHIFEKQSNGFYISNGAFKGAMLKAGFNVDDQRDTNWYFNVSQKSVEISKGRAS